MGRKKKDGEPLRDLGRDAGELTIEKSHYLLSIKKSGLFDLPEYRILDAYLGRINSRNSGQRTVVIAKGDLENLFGTERIRIEDLKTWLTHLGTPISVTDSRKRRGFTLISLFEKSVAVQDESGLWQIELTASQSAMEYFFFDAESVTYLKYKLKWILPLTSLYSYYLFLYLLDNRFRSSWTINLDQLKTEVLACDEVPVYQEFKHFNAKVLKKAQAEILEKTELRFSYEPVKVGRRVGAIRFTVESKSVQIGDVTPVDPAQVSFEDYQDDYDYDYDYRTDTSKVLSEREKICLGFDEEVFSCFTLEELSALKAAAVGVLDQANYQRHLSAMDAKEAAQWATSEYLAKVITVAKTRKGVKHFFPYVLSIVQSEAEKTAAEQE
jgi:plasmid replication initiation protein